GSASNASSALSSIRAGRARRDAQGARKDPAGGLDELDAKPPLRFGADTLDLPAPGPYRRPLHRRDTDGAAEWEVMSRPVTFKKGHEVRARVHRLGNPPTAPPKYWAAHEKIQVRRNTLSRPAAIIDEADDEAARNRELRRLRAEIRRLEEEKQDLMRRLAFVERELEKTRAKVPRGMSTSWRHELLAHGLGNRRWNQRGARRRLGNKVVA